jgi:hypothetical protein
VSNLALRLPTKAAKQVRPRRPKIGAAHGKVESRLCIKTTEGSAVVSLLRLKFAVGTPVVFQVRRHRILGFPHAVDVQRRQS